MVQQEPALKRTGLLMAFMLAGAGLILQGQGGCQPPPKVTITSPSNGTFSSAGSILVEGTINRSPSNHTVDVNGVAATVLPDRTWSVTVPLDAAAVFNTLKATMTNAVTLSTRKDIVTVVAGDSLDENELAFDSVGVRINESGLADLQPFIEGQINFDIASLVPPGTLVIDNFCYQDSIFGCLGRVDATVSGNPPPSISDFAIGLDSQNNFIDVDPTLFDLFVRADVVAVTGIPFSCTVDISAATTTIQSDINLEPLASDPTNLDAIQQGGVSVSFSQFGDSTNCGGFLGFIVEFFIDLFIGDFQSLMQPALEDFLNTTDGNGNTPIAAALETALNGIDITGPIGGLLQADLTAPISSIVEDTTGATIALDTMNVATCPPGNGPDLTRSYAIDSPFPTFGPTTPPPGNLPYGIGVCLSANAFNQLLRTLTECGLLNLTVTEIDLLGSPQPITAGLLALFVPELGGLDPSTPMQFDASAQLAPVITDQPGPSGELVALKLGDLQLALNTTPPLGNPFVTVSIGASVGVDLAFDQASNSLDFLIANPLPGSLSVEIVQNAIGTDEVTLELVLESVLPAFFPSIVGALGSLPIPSFSGLEISPVEISRNGDFLSLFGDAVPAP